MVALMIVAANNFMISPGVFAGDYRRFINSAPGNTGAVFVL